MPILNPQYAFLEADYDNPILTQIIPKIEKSSEEVQKKSEPIRNPKIALKTLQISAYIKTSWILVWLISLPVDLYFIVVLMILEILK